MEDYQEILVATEWRRNERTDFLLCSFQRELHLHLDLMLSVLELF